MASFLDIVLAAAPVAGQAAAGFAEGQILAEQRKRERAERERRRLIEEARNELLLEQLRLGNERTRRDLNAPPPAPKVTVRRPTDAGEITVTGDPSQVGAVLPTLPDAASPEEDPVNWQTVTTADGIVQVNPRTGEVRPLGLQAPPRSTGLGGRRMTEMQAKMRVAYARAVPALRQIEQFLGYDPETGQFAAGGGDVPEESFLGRLTPGRYFQSPEVQAYDRAAEAVASAILRVESGAAITESEIESYKRQFVPRPGDKPEVVRRKLEALRTTLEAIREAANIPAPAGGGAAPGPTPPRNPFR
ncbi:MAG TPA: hypothetical protein VF158_08120 [Longimicrobiales bacterium]